MKLLRLCAQEIQVGRPLPWGVRNEPGQLLLNKGAVLHDAGQLAALLDRGMYVDADEYEEEKRRQAAAKDSVFDPFSVWAAIQRQVGHLLRNHAASDNFADDMGTLGREIQSAIGQDVDLGKFQMIQNESSNYAVTHSLQTAFVAFLAAHRLGASELEMSTAVSAALTMNIGMLDLQNLLVSQTTPVTPEQRRQIDQHAKAGRAILEQRGVTQSEWLRAIEQHHPTSGGGPLPENRSHLSEVACLIHYVDVYLAKLSARATRPALASQAAAQQLFLSGGGASNVFISAIVKEMGIYPPGTYVKLANGETAVVVRTGENAHTPQVRALVPAQGLPHLDPIARDTANPLYKVMSTVPRSNIMVRLNRPRLLGYEG
jgi:HD-GYP domain-containing protein (c-di-GMP phosphodiesterase class II)